MRFSVPPFLARLALALLFLAPASALAKDVQIVVVPVHAKPNPAFDASVNRLIDKPLRRQGTVIPTPQFRAAAKRAHVKPMAIALPRNLRTLGRHVHATHVLVIEVSGRGRGAAANTTLFDVGTGRILLTDSYSMGAPRLTPEVASQMLGPIIDALGGTQTRTDMGEEDTGAEEEPATKPTSKMGKGGKGFAFPGKGDKGDKEDTGDEGADTADEGENAVETTVKTEPDADDPHFTPLRLNVGATFMQRTARLTPGGGTGTPPCYCGTGGNNNPFFPAPEISAEIFPMAFKASNGHHWYENLGLQADFFITRVNSYVDTNPNNTIGSTIYSFSGALAYRLNWRDSSSAPDTFFHLGYNYFQFPLANGAFPGVSYGSPYVGAELHVPIPWLEQLSIVGGVDYNFALKAGNNAATALGTEANGFGVSANGGARVSIDHFEITALYRYQLYDVAYTGNTALSTRGATTNTALPVYTNVTLKDALNEITLMVGYRF